MSKSDPVPPGLTNPPGELARLKDLVLSVAREGISISDLRLPDNPIIYANEGFERLTGYSVAESLGRNCRFLQGAGTDPETARRIREAVAEGRAETVDILNYRKDGSPFWNRLALTPVRGEGGEVTHYVGIQSDISERKRAEEKLAKANERMSQSLEAAAAIQRSLLPDKLPEVSGVDFAWIFDPCDELAGDSLDVFPIDRDNLALYVLDVSGHGVPAALLSVTLARILSFSRRQSSLAGSGSFADRELIASPKAATERLNQLFPMSEESRQYFTLFYGVLHLPTRELRYVSAGHPAPVVLSPDADSRHISVAGFPIGMAREPEYRERTLQLDPGERLFLYTDGLLEATADSGEEFGAERVGRAVEEGRELSLEAAVRHLDRAARSWADGGLHDDLSILALEIEDDGRPSS